MNLVKPQFDLAQNLDAKSVHLDELLTSPVYYFPSRCKLSPLPS